MDEDTEAEEMGKRGTLIFLFGLLFIPFMKLMLQNYLLTILFKNIIFPLEEKRKTFHILIKKK